MKRMVGMLAALAVVGTGCGASEQYVKQQVDPVSDRLSKVEATLGDLQKQSSAQAADIQSIKASLADAKASAAAAQAAADRAEAAAKAAEAASTKSTKAFKLQQKK